MLSEIVGPVFVPVQRAQYGGGLSEAQMEVKYRYLNHQILYELDEVLKSLWCVSRLRKVNLIL